MATLDWEWSSRPDGGMVDLESLKRRSWPGLAAYAVKIAAPACFDFKMQSPSNSVVLRDFYRNDGETRIGTLPPNTTKDLRGKLAYIPAGCAVEGWQKFDKPAGSVVVIIDQNASPRERTVDLQNLPPRSEFEDPLLRSLILRFQAILDDPSLDTPGYAETLAELLIFELSRLPAVQRPPAGHSALGPDQIKRVTEYMDARLSEKISIAELANLVDVTRFHFIRAFKQSTGTPPHQYVIRRRVERAKELLAAPHVSIAEVAERTGFGSPVQLTRAFRRFVGITPSAFRVNDC